MEQDPLSDRSRRRIEKTIANSGAFALCMGVVFAEWAYSIPPKNWDFVLAAAVFSPFLLAAIIFVARSKTRFSLLIIVGTFAAEIVLTIALLRPENAADPSNFMLHILLMLLSLYVLVFVLQRPLRIWIGLERQKNEG